MRENKRSKNVNKYRDFAWELKNAADYERDVDTNCDLSSWNGYQGPETYILGANKIINFHHVDHSTIRIY